MILNNFNKVVRTSKHHGLLLKEEMGQATYTPDIRYVQELLDKGATLEERNNWNDTPLISALIRQYNDSALLLIETGADVRAVGYKGRTPLSIAVQRGDIDLVRALLAKNADPNTLDEDGKTPLIYAAANGRADILEELLKAKADPNLSITNDFLMYPLSVAAEEGFLDSVRLLLKYNALIDAQNTTFLSTALMLAAMKGRLEVVRELIDAGADINAVNKMGASVLFYAASSGQLDVVMELLERGADITPVTAHGETALSVAVRKEYTEIAQLIASKDKSAQNEHHVLSFLAAAEHGQVDIVRSMIGKGVPYDAQDSKGKTALMLAAKAGHLDIVRLLLSYNVDLFIRDHAGKTAYDHACDFQEPLSVSLGRQLGGLSVENPSIEIKRLILEQEAVTRGSIKKKKIEDILQKRVKLQESFHRGPVMTVTKTKKPSAETASSAPASQPKQQ